MSVGWKQMCSGAARPSASAISRSIAEEPMRVVGRVTPNRSRLH